MNTALARTIPPDVQRLRWALDHPAVRYLLTLAKGSRPTQTTALRHAAVYFSGLLGLAPSDDPTRLPWERVDRPMVLALRAELLVRFAPATATRTLSAVRGVLAEVLPRTELDRVWDRIPPVRGRREPTGRMLTDEELVALFGACEATARGARDAALLALLVGAGLRRHEVCALALADVTTDDQGEIHVRHGKGDVERRVPVSRGLARHLRAWVEFRGPEPGALLCSVFRTAYGYSVRIGPLALTSVNHAIDRLAARAGVDPFGSHDGRRTCISRLLEQADVVTVAAIAGHASPATTARYDRRPERARRAALEALSLP